MSGLSSDHHSLGSLSSPSLHRLGSLLIGDSLIGCSLRNLSSLSRFLFSGLRSLSRDLCNLSRRGLVSEGSCTICSFSGCRCGRLDGS